VTPTKQELQAIIQNPLSDEQQRSDARALLEKLIASSAEELDPTAEIFANYARSSADPAVRAERFEMFRQSYKNNPEFLKSFTPDREHLRVRRLIWDEKTWQVTARLFDEEIAAKNNTQRRAIAVREIL
jgi:hypothetical protein